MPLYLIVIGAVLKVLVQYALVKYESTKLARHILAERRLRDEETQECTAHYIPLNNGLEANTGTMVDDRQTRAWRDCLKELISKTAHIYFVVSVIAQLVLDIQTVVTNSQTSTGWQRYQCYAETFMNSPNISSYVGAMLYEILRRFYTLGYSTDEGYASYRIKRFSMSVLYLCYMSPGFTHGTAFIFIYIWVFVLFIVSVLCVECCCMCLRVLCKETTAADHPLYQVVVDDIRDDPQGQDEDGENPGNDTFGEYTTSVYTYGEVAIHPFRAGALYESFADYVRLDQHDENSDYWIVDENRRASDFDKRKHRAKLWDIHWSTGPLVSMVLACVMTFLTALTGSVMVRWYSDPEDYIGSLWEALNDRHTRAFLDRETENLQQKAGNWFPYIHYFV